jgi:beta-lactamase superfamily II metal-dependent hydrolase
MGTQIPEALERLTKYAKEILSTIDRGTISFATDGASMEVTTQK